MAGTFTDTFGGSGALGNVESGGVSWQVLLGTASRLDGKLNVSQPGAAVIDASSANVEVSANVSGYGDAIYFRVKDMDNWWRFVAVRDEYITQEQRRQFGIAYNHEPQTGTSNCPGNYLGGPDQYTVTINNYTTSANYTQEQLHNLYVGGGFVTGVAHQHAGQSFSSNYYAAYVSYYGEAYTVDITNYTYKGYLEQNVNGTITRVATYQFNALASTIKVRTRANQISVYANGELLGSVQSDVHKTEKKHGLGRTGLSPSGSNATSIDNFYLTLIEPLVPTITTPAPNTIVTSSRPTLVGVTGTYDSPAKIEWQLATDAVFTQNVKNIIEPDSALRATGVSGSLQIPAGSSLTQTRWYLRARGVDANGITGEWSTSISFTVSHAPGAINMRPTGGDGLLHAASSRLSWQFSDPDPFDSQRAYQLVIERNDTGALVLDTGKTVSGQQFHDYAIPVELRDIALRWRLKTWDSEDVESSWSLYNVFVPSLAPTITILSPTNNGTVISGAPTTTWSFAASAGRTQKSYRVEYKRNSDNVVVFNSGVVAGTATSYRPPYSILHNDTNYTITVTVVDSTNISNSASVTFLTEYIAPAPINFSVSVDQYESDGYVLIEWNAVVDDSFLFWRLYRREVGDENWKILTEIPDRTLAHFNDWIVASQTFQEYSIVQVVERFGEQVESAISESIEVYVESGGYWLIDRVDPNQNSVRLHNVTEDTYKLNRERAEVLVVGRGRHVDVGENIGISGSLTAKLRDTDGMPARAKKRKLEAMADLGEAVYLRNPFGDIYLVSIGDPEVSRIAGVGYSEFVDVSLSYSEVF